MEKKHYDLIVFDVDGTLVTTKSGATFRKSADDWQWLPGRLEKLRELRRQGVFIATASNQGGVASGYLDQKQILHEITRLTKEAHLSLGGQYICYNHPKAVIDQYRYEDDRRKPGPGMLLEAMSDFNVESGETLMVGDRDEDRLAAQAAGCDFMHSEEFFNGR